MTLRPYLMQVKAPDNKKLYTLNSCALGENILLISKTSLTLVSVWQYGWSLLTNETEIFSTCMIVLCFHFPERSISVNQNETPSSTFIKFWFFITKVTEKLEYYKIFFASSLIDFHLFSFNELLYGWWHNGF